MQRYRYFSFVIRFRWGKKTLFSSLYDMKTSYVFKVCVTTGQFNIILLFLCTLLPYSHSFIVWNLHSTFPLSLSQPEMCSWKHDGLILYNWGHCVIFVCLCVVFKSHPSHDGLKPRLHNPMLFCLSGKWFISGVGTTTRQLEGCFPSPKHLHLLLVSWATRLH